mmetsp:Transcript_20626/g.56314  ORF Transcript_20626/g.56314 Transcript_20626/m.56314 type:complete len:243 (-) Transcript_20626:57-785(-)
MALEAQLGAWQQRCARLLDLFAPDVAAPHKLQGDWSVGQYHPDADHQRPYPRVGVPAVRADVVGRIVAPNRCLPDSDVVLLAVHLPQDVADGPITKQSPDRTIVEPALVVQGVIGEGHLSVRPQPLAELLQQTLPLHQTSDEQHAVVLELLQVLLAQLCGLLPLYRLPQPGRLRHHQEEPVLQLLQAPSPGLSAEKHADYQGEYEHEASAEEARAGHRSSYCGRHRRNWNTAACACAPAENQ